MHALPCRTPATSRTIDDGLVETAVGHQPAPCPAALDAQLHNLDDEVPANPDRALITRYPNNAGRVGLLALRIGTSGNEYLTVSVTAYDANNNVLLEQDVLMSPVTASRWIVVDGGEPGRIHRIDLTYSSPSGTTVEVLQSAIFE